MIVVRDLNQVPADARRGAVSIGNFDGVHLGHVHIVQRLRQMAQRLSGPAVVFTFDPPPARILRPQQAPALLTWIERKAELLAQLGVDVMIACPTDKAFLNLDSRAFFDQILGKTLAARGMIEGPDFFFGRGRSGTIDVLRQFCDQAGIALEVASPVMQDDQPISSSRIRALVAAGLIDEASSMLTAPYRIRGTVIHGAGRGRTLGFPTANLGQPDTLLPGDGIYAGRAAADGAVWPAAISVGPNPTFGEGARKVEVFLVDYSGNLYDRELEVDFLTRLRDTKKFTSVEQLIAQMNADVAATRQAANALN